MAKYLKHDYPKLKITLTDYYPNTQAFERVKAEGEGVFDYETTSVNAMAFPIHLQGKFRTIFAAFHHFRPKEAASVLQNAVDTNSSIAIFEPLGRNAGSFFSMLFVILNVLLLTPFIRPVRLSVLPFIYIIPIIPLYILWDGIASILRTYSENELKEMVSGLNNSSSFEWEIEKKANGPMPIYYLLGTPKKV